MTDKQRRFADEYIKDCNSTQAAIRAGYSRKTARVQASDLLTKPDIRAYIDAQLAEIHARDTADAAEVMRYLTSVMRGEHTEQLLKLDGDGVQSIVDVDVQAKDRIKAAELIGKRYGMFKDGVTLSGAVPVVIAGEDDLED